MPYKSHSFPNNNNSTIYFYVTFSYAWITVTRQVLCLVVSQQYVMKSVCEKNAYEAVLESYSNAVHWRCVWSVYITTVCFCIYQSSCLSRF